jgi:hypothetical protein
MLVIVGMTGALLIHDWIGHGALSLQACFRPDGSRHIF